MKLVASFLLLMLICPLSLSADAQNADWERVLRLKKGSELLVQRTDGTVVSGKIGDSYGKTLVLISGNARVIRVYQDDVYAVTRVKHRGIRRPLLLGLGIGAGTGYIAGRAAETEWDRQEDPGLLPAVTTLAGCAVGATVGLIIGLARTLPKDKVIYQAAE